MVETISPVVHGGRTRSYWLNISLHTAGALIAAGAIGALLGGVGAALGAPWGSLGILLVVAFGVAYALRDLLRLPIPMPELRRQVPEWWRSFFSAPVTSMLYGLGLGVAFFTHLSFGTFVVVAIAAVATGDPLGGALLCAPFGLGRALVVAATDLERIDDPPPQRFFARANGLTSLLLAASALVLG